MRKFTAATLTALFLAATVPATANASVNTTDTYGCRGTQQMSQAMHYGSSVTAHFDMECDSSAGASACFTFAPGAKSLSGFRISISGPNGIDIRKQTTRVWGNKVCASGLAADEADAWGRWTATIYDRWGDYEYAGTITAVSLDADL